MVANADCGETDPAKQEEPGRAELPETWNLTPTVARRPRRRHRDRQLQPRRHSRTRVHRGYADRRVTGRDALAKKEEPGPMPNSYNLFPTTYRVSRLVIG